MVGNRIDGLEAFRKQLEGADIDLLREMVKIFAKQLMGAEVDALCGADYGERSEDRVNRRNGYRHRDFDTRAGTLDVAVPKLRTGSYFPEWLLERRKRAERALTSVVATWSLTRSRGHGWCGDHAAGSVGMGSRWRCCCS